MPLSFSWESFDCVGVGKIYRSTGALEGECAIYLSVCRKGDHYGGVNMN